MTEPTPRSSDSAPQPAGKKALREVSKGTFVSDLLTQVFSDRARIDAGRYCAYNGFLGLILLAAALALRYSGSRDPLGAAGFALVVSSALVLIAALIVPL